jgi:hypothetical protein
MLGLGLIAWTIGKNRMWTNFDVYGKNITPFLMMPCCSKSAVAARDNFEVIASLPLGRDIFKP